MRPPQPPRHRIGQQHIPSRPVLHLGGGETGAIGALAARGQRFDPPYSSEDVSAALGVDPGKYARHTALGDAQWARDLYDAAMRPA